MPLDCTCSALRMAARRLTQVYDAALAPQGLNTPQYALLSRLSCARNEAPTLQHLADRMGLDRTTLAHNLGPLERDGFVMVTADPKDRRVRRIMLTPTGRAKRNACLPLWQAAQQQFNEDFGAERSAALLDALHSIAELYAPPLGARPHQESPTHAG